MFSYLDKREVLRICSLRVQALSSRLLHATLSSLLFDPLMPYFGTIDFDTVTWTFLGLRDMRHGHFKDSDTGHNQSFNSTG